MEYGESVPKEPKCLRRQFDPKKNALTTKIKVKRKKNLDCIDSRHLYLLYFQSVLWDSWEENNAFEEYIAFDA